MMGIISSGMVVIPPTNILEPAWRSLLNREWAMAIQGVNARSWTISPFVILKGQYNLANWYTECDLSGDWVLVTAQNG